MISGLVPSGRGRRTARCGHQGRRRCSPRSCQGRLRCTARLMHNVRAPQSWKMQWMSAWMVLCLCQALTAPMVARPEAWVSSPGRWLRRGTNRWMQVVVVPTFAGQFPLQSEPSRTYRRGQAVMFQESLTQNRIPQI